jgi:hypothetical protein
MFSELVGTMVSAIEHVGSTSVPGFAALEPENPPPFLTRCVPPSTASIKKSSTCSKTLASLQKLSKTLPRSLRFRTLKTVRDQNWWAA